jgi:hypothetical protein
VVWGAEPSSENKVRVSFRVSKICLAELRSPSGELISAPPKINFIDLRQIEANWYQMLTKITKIEKIHVKKIQGRYFLGKKRPCGNAPQHRQGLGSTICSYLPLINRSSAAICR